MTANRRGVTFADTHTKGRCMIERLRLLLVDGYTDEAEMYALGLGRLGANVTAVTSVNDGIATAAHEPFDVVVGDVWFSETHGYELARAIRAAGSRVTMIALGNISEPDEEGRSLAAGFDAYCPRPCTPSQLAEHIAQIVAQTKARGVEE